jgi:hypothetical protein
MKNVITIASCLLFLVANNSLHAQVFSKDNAAYYYVEAAQLLAKEPAKENVDSKLIQKSIQDFKPFYDHKKIDATKILELLQAGNACSFCDWKTDYSEGSISILPHAQGLRDLIYFTLSLSMKSCIDGNYRKACDDLLNAMALARQLSHDKCLVMLLSSYSKQRDAIAVGKTLCEKLGQEDIAYLEQKWKELPKTKELKDIVLDEMDIFVNWIKNKPVAFFRFLDAEEVNDFGLVGFRLNEEAPGLVEILRSLARQQLVRYQHIEQYYRDVAEATNLPKEEFLSRYNSLYKGIPNRKTTPLTKQILTDIFPAVGASFMSREKLRLDEKGLMNVIRRLALL